MGKSILVVTHGMGEHTAEATKKKVIKAANIALSRYPSSKDTKFEDHVEIVSIGYDDIFEAERKRIKAANEPISAYFKTHSNLPASFIQQIVSLESRIDKDTFFTTHILDVLLYAGLHGPRVRLRLAEKFAEAMSTRTSDQAVHVMAHSLGTAAMHDMLAKLYDKGIEDENGKRHAYTPGELRIDSLWMISNVSQLLYSVNRNVLGTSLNPLLSKVKPATDDSGCAEYFFNVFHEFDPFTLFGRFDPKFDEEWVSARVFQRNYVRIETERFTYSANPHDLVGYLTNPNVAIEFLDRVMPTGTFNVSDAEVDEAHRDVQDVHSGVKAIKDYVSAIDSFDDLKGLVSMIKAYGEFIEGLLGQDPDDD
ncbi:hypothetical protein LRP49_14810 [Enterovibrio sp. ZSDZ35]|uniref:Alpha/beta hydrolase n=1 Tax=Enterovibrio qingdaonensis TaxID=2899818 RepID=A0ABT5QN73_9GAMM|nr:hypothetical protein [Enterovibrio sp. ZSDZ35]MDD1782440.1 hypothetical protein [Enterovibrio sp. ZSDZ35]